MTEERNGIYTMIIKLCCFCGKSRKERKNAVPRRRDSAEGFRNTEKGIVKCPALPAARTEKEEGIAEEEKQPGTVRQRGRRLRGRKPAGKNLHEKSRICKTGSVYRKDGGGYTGMPRRKKAVWTVPGTGGAF